MMLFLKQNSKALRVSCVSKQLDPWSRDMLHVTYSHMALALLPSLLYLTINNPYIDS
jgi:hypothetical protein